MKRKADFVTNSSSASFVLYIETSTTDSSEFQNIFQAFIKAHEEEHSWREKRIAPMPDVEHISGNVFAITDWTGMYNGIEDIPDYMKYLIIKCNMYGEMIEYGIKSVKLKVQEEG